MDRAARVLDRSRPVSFAELHRAAQQVNPHVILWPIQTDDGPSQRRRPEQTRYSPKFRPPLRSQPTTQAAKHGTSRSHTTKKRQNPSIYLYLPIPLNPSAVFAAVCRIDLSGFGTTRCQGESDVLSAGVEKLQCEWTASSSAPTRLLFHARKKNTKGHRSQCCVIAHHSAVDFCQHEPSAAPSAYSCAPPFCSAAAHLRDSCRPASTSPRPFEPRNPRSARRTPLWPMTGGMLLPETLQHRLRSRPN